MAKSPELIKDRYTFQELHRKAKRCVEILWSNSREQEKLFFEDSDCFRGGFFSFLARLAILAGGKSFYFIAVKPDPIGYFFASFNKYPAFVLSAAHAEKDYLRLLNEDPGGSPADALAHNSERYILYSKDGSWFIYGDRVSELAVLSLPRAMLAPARAAFPFRLIQNASLDDFARGQ